MRFAIWFLLSTGYTGRPIKISVNDLWIININLEDAFLFADFAKEWHSVTPLNNVLSEENFDA